MRFATRPAAMLLLLLIGGLITTCRSSVPLNAHEIGSTRVSVIFSEAGTYEIELVTDAAALIEKLHTSGSPAPALPADRMHDLLASLDATFRTRVAVSFDGEEQRPTIGYSVVPPQDTTSAAMANIQLTGPIPAAATHFTWKYSWTFSSYALSIRPATQNNPVTEWLGGGQSSMPFALVSAVPRRGDRLDTAWQYLTLGFTHIVPMGLDHVLFVLGIYLLSARIRSVLWQVSAFTVAHSITLGLSMFGVLNVSAAIVEPLIALSIAYVAIENIFVSELKSWRVALVFAFGLLHGMGFAGALKELGLPRSEFVMALLTFNLGVEAGQLTVISAAFLFVGCRWAQRGWYRNRIVVPASVLIACTAVYWTIARLAF
jgi:hydrogenase/urease accessory protein HupE